MNKLKKTLIGGLTAILLSVPSNSKAQQLVKHYFDDPTKIEIVGGTKKIALTKEDVFNSFLRPNTLNESYYGNGDVNDDGIVDQADYDLMKTRTVLNDQADVDGDGNPTTTSDLVLLEDHLNNGTILPGDWNKLKTRESRENWLNRMLAIDKTDELPYIKEDHKWTCTNFSIQILLNFFGFKKFEDNHDDIPSEYDISYNGRFNLPVYSVGIFIPPSLGHAINCILVGDNPLNFSDWYFFEPQDDEKVKLSMSEKQVDIGTIYQFEGDSFYAFNLLTFYFNKDNIDLTYQNPDLVLTRPSTDIINVENTVTPFSYSLKQNYPNPFNSLTSIEYNLKNPSYLVLEIYNSLGQKLETLVDAYQSAGKYSVNWNANDYSSGIYFYKLKIDDAVESKKMMLVK